MTEAPEDDASMMPTCVECVDDAKKDDATAGMTRFEQLCAETFQVLTELRAERAAKRKRQPNRPNECGIARSELQKMKKPERTRRNNVTGIVEGLCNDCTCAWRSIRSAFLPDATKERCVRAHAELVQALDAYEDAVTNGKSTQAQVDALYATIVSKRMSQCRECISQVKLSPAQLECKAEWERMKREACEKHNGCSNPECSERGMASWVCLSADHLVPEDKVCALSEYNYWSCHDGVRAMREEWEKVRFLCNCCHILLPTSTAGQGWSEAEKKRAPNQYAIVKAKQDYVDARKLQLGACQYPGCARPVTPSTTRSFDFDHDDPTRTKATHESDGDILTKVQKGVAGMVHNRAKRTALHLIKPRLDAEMDKCKLYCRNCHHCRKPAGRARWDAS